MRKISWLMTSCTIHPEFIRIRSSAVYAAQNARSFQSVLSAGTLNKIKVSVAPTNNSPSFPCIISSPPHRARHVYRPTRNTSFFFVVFNRAFGVTDTVRLSN